MKSSPYTPHSTMKISQKYLEEVRKKNKQLDKNMIKKDLVLSYVLQELAKREELVFKGGTCLVKCYLDYHRLSEDLDFSLNKTMKSLQETRRYFKNQFLPHLQEIADKYGLDFDQEEFSQATTKYCPIKQHKHLFRFFLYLDETPPIKIEINISERPQIITKRTTIQLNKNSKHLTYPLQEHTVQCYTMKEIILEKVRAILTRKEGFSERDVFDLFIINKQQNIFPLDKTTIKRKIRDSFVYDAEAITANKKELEQVQPFQEIESLATTSYDKREYEEFFEKLRREILKEL